MEDVAAEAGVSRALVSARDARVAQGQRRVAARSCSPPLARGLPAEPDGSQPGVAAHDDDRRCCSTTSTTSGSPRWPTASTTKRTPTATGSSSATAGARPAPRGRRDRVVPRRSRSTASSSPAAGCAEARSRRSAARCPSWPSAGRCTPSVVATVNNDDRLGARIAVEHLVALGHDGSSTSTAGGAPAVLPRRAGYQAAMAAPGSASTCGRSAATSPSCRERGRCEPRSGRDLPTAIFTANDLSAAGRARSAERGGPAVPEDVSLVGYDNTALAAMHHIALTTVDQPRVEMGRRAFQALLERINRPRTMAVDHAVSPTLVVRRTTAPVCRELATRGSSDRP